MRGVSDASFKLVHRDDARIPAGELVFFVLRKEAILPEDLIAMLEALDRAGLRNRAVLLIGFARGLRRSKITGLDLGRDQTEAGAAGSRCFAGKASL
ncbi:integrase [Rhizobium mongolense]|uniref:Integrase n=1 Tax=Rhizobium mongolense TaxID=57676 RepID=A0A7W6RT52_9HYPH|nr:integrase [Rhizobium mongolense]